jgi:phage terminase small subunit
MELTLKQEAFCIKYIETGNASKAYKLAYNADNMKPDSVYVEATKLLDNPKIALRVAELQAEHRDRHKVTIDSLTDELEKAKQFAYDLESPNAVISAIIGKAKLHGLFDKKGDDKGKELPQVVVIKNYINDKPTSY